MRSIITAPTKSSLSQNVGLRVENVDLAYDKQVLHNLSMSVPAGQIVALLGPSGCGKTSLLRSVAGLKTPLAGQISTAGEILFDSQTKRNIKPEHRKVGMVFQDLALFPHLNVAGNVSYGLPRKHNPEILTETLDLVGLAGFENRRISTLSGGQRQRVALARALAPQPEVLLLDEPFSNLDEPTRVELRSQVSTLLAELQITAIFVTHDQEEAFIVGDQVAVMSDEGRIEQQDSPANLYTRPKNRWVADFVGHANLITGKVEGQYAKTSQGNIELLDPVPQNGALVDVLVRPEDFVFVDCNETQNKHLEISYIEYYGHDTLYLLNDPSTSNEHGSNEQGQIWVRLVDHRGNYTRGSKVCLKHVGPPAISFTKQINS